MWDTLSTRYRNTIDFKEYGFTDLQILGKYNYNKSEAELPEHKHEACLCTSSN